MATFSNDDGHSLKGRATTGALMAIAIILALVLTGFFTGWPLRALAGVIGLLGIGLAIMQARSTIRAATVIVTASEALKRASNGDLNNRVTGVQRDDEIGRLVLNLNRLMDLVEAFAKDAGAAMEFAGRGQYFRRIMLEGLRGEFAEYSKRINGVIGTMADRRTATKAFADERVAPAVGFLAEAADDLSSQAERLRTIASATIEQSVTVASSANQATASVETVAAAAEELSASIGEINRQTGEAMQIATNAVAEVEHTNGTVAALNDAAEKIGEVVELIRDVANQTNLLALNATIEAARAGEAGKGFAVVANEVKNLANQTSRATEDITAQVGAMQSITQDTVTTIRRIGDTIALMNENIQSVTAAVGEQAAATAEISRSAHEAAAGTQDVAARIDRVSSDAQRTNDGAVTLLEASKALKGEASSLQTSLGEFMDRMV